MSSNYSANQYEGAFNPQRLQNYEIPASLTEQRPATRYGSTQIISNNKGHIVVESKRSSSSPWGSFVGTWQAERKPIQLMTRTKLQCNFSNIKFVNPLSKASIATADGGSNPDALPVESIKGEESLANRNTPSGCEDRSDVRSPSRPPTVVSEMNIDVEQQ